MRALSIRQPWVELILRGEKDVENRTWRTRHRGPLVLHASRTVDRAALARYGSSELPRGCLVGLIEVVDCTLEMSSEWHLEDCWGWYLRKPRRFARPIPWAASVGIFHVDDELVNEAMNEMIGPGK